MSSSHHVPKSFQNDLKDEAPAISESFVRGTTHEIDQMLDIIKFSDSGLSDYYKGILSLVSVFGYNTVSMEVWISVPRILEEDGSEFIGLVRNISKTYYSGKWVIGGCIDELSVDEAIAYLKYGNVQRGVIIYSDRPDKSENAPAFLKRVYADELAAGSLTLSELKQLDKSLWSGLRNWAHAGGHDLDVLIPRGRNRPGRPRAELNFDPNILDPSDPRDALTLQALRNRDQSRERMQKRRARPELG